MSLLSLLIGHLEEEGITESKKDKAELRRLLRSSNVSFDDSGFMKKDSFVKIDTNLSDIQMKQAFDVMDTDHDGKISRNARAQKQCDKDSSDESCDRRVTATPTATAGNAANRSCLNGMAIQKPLALVRNLCGRFVTSTRILFEALQTDRLKILINAGVQSPRRNGFVVDDLHDRRNR